VFPVVSWALILGGLSILHLLDMIHFPTWLTAIFFFLGLVVLCITIDWAIWLYRSNANPNGDYTRLFKWGRGAGGTWSFTYRASAAEFYFNYVPIDWREWYHYRWNISGGGTYQDKRFRVGDKMRIRTINIIDFQMYFVVIRIGGSVALWSTTKYGPLPEVLRRKEN